MAKNPRLSIRAALPDDAQDVATPEREGVTPSQRDDAKTSPRSNAKPSSRPHASIYLGKPAMKALKQIAVERDCKVHDLLLEGVRHVLAQYGKDLDALNRD
jgi:hypothetical protein